MYIYICVYIYIYYTYMYICTCVCIYDHCAMSFQPSAIDIPMSAHLMFTA